MPKVHPLVVVSVAVVATASISAFINQEPTKAPTAPSSAQAILGAKCGKCHNPKVKFDPKSRLNMILRGALVPGSPGASKILQAISAGAMPPAGNPAVTPEEAATLTAWVAEGAKDWAASPGKVEAIFKANCAKCHSEFMDPSKEVRAKLATKGVLLPGMAADSKMMKVLNAGAMPPAGNPKLSPEDVAAIGSWMNAGAYHWTELPTRAQAILQTNCSKCHNAGGSFDVGNLDQLMNKSLIVAGKPGESKAIGKIMAGQMPPAGNPKVSARDLAILKAWVADGAGEWPPKAETR